MCSVEPRNHSAASGCPVATRALASSVRASVLACAAQSNQFGTPIGNNFIRTHIGEVLHPSLLVPYVVVTLITRIHRDCRKCFQKTRGVLIVVTIRLCKVCPVLANSKIGFKRPKPTT